jgi:hypothetical protein
VIYRYVAMILVIVRISMFSYCPSKASRVVICSGGSETTHHCNTNEPQTIDVTDRTNSAVVHGIELGLG